ncbi:MAG: site-specific integrase, partial [Campylobacterota bacterium]|nr:site-specific integrase [Campylobacterota bacterium]
ELPPQIKKRMKKDIVTLDNLAKVYFEDKVEENKANKKQEGRYNLHIKELLGSKDIHSITKEDVKKLQQHLLNKSKAPKTINGITTLLRAIINYSIKEKDLKLVNPAVGVKNLKTDDKRERFLSLDEIKLLIENVKDNERLYHFVKMALSTGARLESVLSIQKKDIDLEHEKITIKDLKNGSTYTGFFSDEVYLNEVKEAINNLKANDYYIGGNETKTPSRTIQRQLKPILDELFNTDLDVRDAKNRVVIHTLRHTFASQLAIAGVPIFTIKNLMNHGDIEMTMRYAKLAPDSGSMAVRGLYG